MRMSLKDKFDKDGYVILENFLSPDEVQRVKEAGLALTKDIDNETDRIVFNTASGSETKKNRDQYLMQSADKVCYFYEDGAVGPKGELLVPADVSLNKVGHALAEKIPAFHEATFNDRVREVCYQLDLKVPVLVQSMYMYKNPKTGSEVGSHQDSTYLYTEPDSLVGFWIALDDATLDNGCLWFIPSSHRGGVHCRSKRNPDLTADEPIIMDRPAPSYPSSSFVSAPVQKGTCVLIHGQVVHRSEPNRSNDSRHAYTFHLYDQGVSKYSPENWLQREKFPRIYQQ
uniref:Phytanoyl-CoA dioxygenase domain-containing protein 1 n=1 Tax=Cacopsylla melanoneura TaxID=428564 RepID=A0A8D8UXX0_9HEMI